MTDELDYQITPKQSQDAIKSLSTIRDFIRWGMSQMEAADCFYGHGTDNAWDEAVALVLPAVHLPLDSNPTILDATLTLDERHAIVDAITRRVNELLPAAYINNQAYFAGMPFYVDERVIIPRSPIAELIQKDFEPWFEDEVPTRILDMCTGSACIAITCALLNEDAEVDAVDISNDALEVARINVDAYDVEDRVNLIESDLFDKLPRAEYDVIIANPPYVPESSIGDLPEEYMHEPEKALVAGHDGLACVNRILQKAASYLSANGILIMEVGEAEDAFLEAYENLPVTWVEFENGGEGVFVISKQDLVAHQKTFQKAS